MRECFHCKQKGDIRDVQPFYCQFNGRGGQVWLHPGDCARDYNAKLRAKEAALGTQQAASKPEQPKKSPARGEAEFRFMGEGDREQSDGKPTTNKPNEGLTQS